MNLASNRDDEERILVMTELSLRNEVDPHISYLNGTTPLTIACLYLLLDVVELLLDKGVDPNIQDEFEVSPIHYATGFYSTDPWEWCYNNHPRNSDDIKIVKLLLSKGADINERNFFCDTALSNAMTNNHTEMIELLLNAGAEPYSPDQSLEGTGPSIIITNLEVRINGKIVLSSNHDTLPKVSDHDTLSKVSEILIENFEVFYNGIYYWGSIILNFVNNSGVY